MKRLSAKYIPFIALPIAALLLAICALVHFDIKGHFDGIFLLKGRHGWKYELKDDLYVGDGDRLIYAVDWEGLLSRTHSLFGPRYRPGEPHIEYDWDEKDGSGIIRNVLSDGTELATSFGRYVDDEQEYVHGLFVGGGLPHSATGDNTMRNDTGMSYFDGTRWYHIWCNVNEGIASATGGPAIPPSMWKFLGSKIIDQSDTSPVITSSHEVAIDGVPLRIDRVAYMFAGETYFVLDIRITNTGDRSVRYQYFYGDEPWVGFYGTSRGDVGWVWDRVIDYETVVDSRRYSYAGIFHYGNDAINEGHDFTRMANFIEWIGEERPFVYFSNQEGSFSAKDFSKVPLSSNERFIGLQWGPREIRPRQTVSYRLAIGMAGFDPGTGLPKKPPVRMEEPPRH